MIDQECAWMKAMAFAPLVMLVALAMKIACPNMSTVIGQTCYEVTLMNLAQMNAVVA